MLVVYSEVMVSYIVRFFNQGTLSPRGIWVLLVAWIFSLMKWSPNSLQGLHVLVPNYKPSLAVCLIDPVTCCLIFILCNQIIPHFVDIDIYKFGITALLDMLLIAAINQLCFSSFDSIFLCRK